MPDAFVLTAPSRVTASGVIVVPVVKTTARRTTLVQKPRQDKNES